jgi:hypothetical protein
MGVAVVVCAPSVAKVLRNVVHRQHVDLHLVVAGLVDALCGNEASFLKNG